MSDFADGQPLMSNAEAASILLNLYRGQSLYLAPDVVQGLEHTIAGEMNEAQMQQLGTVVLFKLMNDGNITLPEDPPVSGGDILAAAGSMFQEICADPALERVLAGTSFRLDQFTPAPAPAYPSQNPTACAVGGASYTPTTSHVAPPAKSKKVSRPRRATSARAPPRSGVQTRSSNLRRAAMVAAATHATHAQ
ncbi:hypothetical protein K466DRAFT_75829 [Polyporus arcularius HHB13444]|uniref:Uncharacterized protein n=1 Tax=Polyporus arcularius HHB13444 TaxID=1314778 RepID=A0A5C3NMQ7_9APHY|nr:hypothetical protein K466DRAFT_75829 [Polyporus arcularius HHB13444]